MFLGQDGSVSFSLFPLYLKPSIVMKSLPFFSGPVTSEVPCKSSSCFFFVLKIGIYIFASISYSVSSFNSGKLVYLNRVVST